MNSFPNKRRPGLHPQEKAVVTVLAVHLVLLPWAFTTRFTPSLFISLTLALAGFLVALWPRAMNAGSEAEAGLVLHPWRKLRVFPLFWLGAGLMLYLLMQALNPAWEYRSDGKVWWMQSLGSIAWLPTNVRAPFTVFNPWRALIIFLSCWLTICTAWAGISRRRSLQILLTILVLGGVTMTAVGIAHRFSGNHAVLWFYPAAGAVGFGPYIYHNHGGAYVALLAIAGLALAAWHHREAAHRMARSAPTLVIVMGTLLMLGGVAFSTSRAAIGILFATFLLSVPTWIWLKRQKGRTTASNLPWLLTLILACAFLGWGGFLLTNADLTPTIEKFANLQKHGADEESYHSRVLSRERAWLMFKDNWIYGTGAGSFRYLFVPYVHKDPALNKVWWDHAHIDWLEFPIELGAVGMIFVFGSLGWVLVQWWRWRGWAHPIGAFLFLACLQTMLHAGVDFPFQNPAILITWWALVIIGLRWVELDRLLDEARQDAARGPNQSSSSARRARNEA